MQVHGSCHCRQINYKATVDPKLTTICHCIDCQKLSATAFRVTVRADEGSFHLLSGKPSVYVKLGDSGAKRAQAFCPNCGSQLFVYDADNPKVYGLRVGCIDERLILIPKKQIWCRSALPWTQSLETMEKSEAA